MSTEQSGRDSTHVLRRDLGNPTYLNLSPSTWTQQNPPITRTQKLHHRTKSTGVRSDNKASSNRKILSSLSSPEIFAPSNTPVFLIPRPEKPTAPRRTSSYHSITPSVQHNSNQPEISLCTLDMPLDSGDDGEDDSMIQGAWLRHKQSTKKVSSGFKEKLFSFATGSNTKSRDKLISTKPGERGAGETETEIDEPPRHLPTSRKITLRGPLIPPSVLQQRLTPLLFEFSRFLSIVPAFFGILYHIYHIYHPPTATISFDGRRPPERVDYIISALWALLTGYQCLCLTTGLLVRWRVYYPPLATLIRLISLQAICWPATHFTLSLLEHEKRPVIVWAVIGTTTCASRSVQIWVTSNLWWEASGGPGGAVGTNGNGNLRENEIDWQRWKGGKWGGRRWDWNDVVKESFAASVIGSSVQLGQPALARWSLGSGDSYLIADGFGLALYQPGGILVTTTVVPATRAQLSTGVWTVTPTATGTQVLQLMNGDPLYGIEVASGVINVGTPSVTVSSLNAAHSTLGTGGIVGVLLGGVSAIMIIFGWIFHRSRAAKKSKRNSRIRGDTSTTAFRRQSNDNVTPYNLRPAWPRESTILPYNLKHEIHETPLATSPSILQPMDNVKSFSLEPTVTLTERQTRLLEEAQSTRDALSILTHQVPEASSQDENTVRTLQMRVAEMMGRMSRLEAQMESDWARGLTNEPPPEYDGL
ncbi:N-glycosylation protein-domain-containing protein [Lentinula guzmanii]|uniref:N-glycosylation protein-domain-containing protein n=1 Tax=Lentinula guzmanii TaxID=2804957 RepID=A0AA38JAD3_9AGAR|nr:N-glycosylation protein-domain-containing protein [Lentinula guzmanii]